MAKDKLYRLTVTFLDDGSKTVYTLAQPTDWGFVGDGQMISIKDVSGVEALFPVNAVWMEIA